MTGYPTLVPVGHTDDTHLLLDLEHLGAVQITGDPAAVTAAATTIATELAASPLADSIDIVCVAFGDELAHLERIRAVDSLEAILPAVEAKAGAVNALGSPTPLNGRLASAGADTWHPLVILDPGPTPPPHADRLLAIAHSGKAVAAVVGYPTGGRWRLHLEDDTIRIDPLGWTLTRRNLTPNEQAAIADLVTAAQDLEGVPADTLSTPLYEALEEPPTSTVATEPAELDAAQPPTVVAAVAVPEVRVLGPVRVDGLSRNFPLRKCTELVAYLTFHRQGVEADRVMEALWPEQPPNYSRLNLHMSRARTTLGEGPDGQPYVPYIRDGLYRVSPQLRSDLERFISHARDADSASGADEIDHLHAALTLVEASPFTGAGNGYVWAHVDGLITHAVVAIDNAAHRLAQLALANDAYDQAEWAARKGLLATWACEECYRNLMRVAIGQDNPVALEAVYTELLAVTDADEGPDAANYLDPGTVKLYEQYTRRRRAG